MNDNRAYMIAHIEMAVLAARIADDPVVERLLEQALREALSAKGKRLPQTLGNVEQNYEPEL